MKDTIRVDKNETLQIVEYFGSSTSSSIVQKDIYLEQNSTLEYIKVSTISKDINLEVQYTIEGENNTKVVFYFLELGLGESTNLFDTKLKEQDQSIDINTLVKIKDKAKVSNSFNIEHIAPNTYSNIKVRHLLDDKSRAVFEAKTIIQDEAIHSKAFQDSKTILLSDDAIIKASPHLEILTDELQASHGAVTGGLDEDAIYYLRSRGIDEQSAKNILIDAFSRYTIENIKDKEIKETLERLI